MAHCPPILLNPPHLVGTGWVEVSGGTCGQFHPREDLLARDGTHGF